MENKTALIIGATGLVGKFCLSYLLNDKDYSKIIVLSRKELGFKNSKIENHIIDFDKISSYSNLLVADEVFCCLGTTIAVAGSKENFRKVDQYWPIEIAKITQAAGAKKFMIVTAMGADKNSSIFYNKVKGEVEEALKLIPFFSLHIFRPSMLTGIRKEWRIGERIAQVLMPIVEIFLIGSLKKYKSIDAMVVANAMLQKAKSNDAGVFVYESDVIQKIWSSK